MQFVVLQQLHVCSAVTVCVTDVCFRWRSLCWH